MDVNKRMSETDRVMAEMLETLDLIQKRLLHDSILTQKLTARVDLSIKRMVKAEERLEKADKRFEDNEKKSNVRFEASEKRMEAFDKRFEASEKRMVAFDKKLNESIKTQARINDEFIKILGQLVKKTL